MTQAAAHGTIMGEGAIGEGGGGGGGGEAVRGGGGGLSSLAYMIKEQI